MLAIRLALERDADAVWGILEPVIRAGETYALSQDLKRDQALEYWTSEEKEVFVAEEEGVVLGTYYLRANQHGGGAMWRTAGM